jgi:hypothetical protein
MEDDHKGILSGKGITFGNMEKKMAVILAGPQIQVIPECPGIQPCRIVVETCTAHKNTKKQSPHEYRKPATRNPAH